jgi:hypothetical protein
MRTSAHRRQQDVAAPAYGPIGRQRGPASSSGAYAVARPEPEEPEEPEPPPMSSRMRSLGLLLVAVLAVVGAVVLQAKQPPPVAPQPPPATGPTAATSGPSPAPPFAYVEPPAEAPPVGTYVRATLGADGTVRVREWITSTSLLDRVTLVPRQPPGATGVRATDVRMAADLFTVTDGATVGDRPRTFAFHAPAYRIHLAYDLHGVVLPGRPPGRRAVVFPTVIDVRYPGRSGSGFLDLLGADVLSAACSTGPDLPRRSCGDATQDGWTVQTDTPGIWVRARIGVP